MNLYDSVCHVLYIGPEACVAPDGGSVDFIVGQTVCGFGGLRKSQNAECQCQVPIFQFDLFCAFDLSCFRILHDFALAGHAVPGQKETDKGPEEGLEQTRFLSSAACRMHELL